MPKGGVTPHYSDHPTETDGGAVVPDTFVDRLLEMYQVPPWIVGLGPEPPRSRWHRIMVRFRLWRWTLRRNIHDFLFPDFKDAEDDW